MGNIETLMIEDTGQEVEIKKYEKLAQQKDNLATLLALANLNKIKLLWPEYKK